jgi:peroxiredoxin
LSTAEKLSLSFEVLSDVGNKVSRDYGIVFTLPETLRGIYKASGIDLPASNGDQTFELPIPATYVVNRQRMIGYAFVNIDYTKRMEPDMIIEVLKKIT